MKHINCKSDFDFIFRLIDCRGEDVGWPKWDWEARIWTSSKANALVASCQGGKPTNCFNDGERIRIVCDGHRLGEGTLKAEVHMRLPDGAYPDGFRDVYEPKILPEIELVSGSGDCPTAIEAEVMLPYIKGEAFTFDDFTPEQLESLKGPKGDEGLSAYEQAVAGGYEGTEQEFQRYLAKADEMVSHVPTDNELEAIEPNIVTDALRKTEQSLTPVEKKQVLKNLDNPEFKLFVDMWLALLTKNADGSVNKQPKGGYFPEREHPFVCNGVEMDFDEALEVYLCSMSTQKVSTNRSYAFAGRTRLRTVLPIIILSSGFNVGFDATYMFFMCQNLEVIDVKGHYGNNDSESLSLNNAVHTFSGCRKLRKIIPSINLYGNYLTASMFSGCESLETCIIKSYNTSVSLAHSPNWSMDSLSRSINARPSSYTKPITFTLHPDAYARVTEELFEAAANKNITIATI